MHFRRRYRWRFGDIDAAGIAYYPSFFHYFHAAFEDWWSDGIGEAYADVMRADHFGLPAVRIECDFIAPVRYGEEPEIALGVLALGGSSVRLGFWIELDGTLRARAEIVTVSVDLRTMTKRPVPAPRRAQLLRFQLGPGEFPPARRP